jgi:hypothetical protein
MVPVSVHACMYVCPYCCKNIKKPPTKYDANTNSQIATMKFKDYHMQIGGKAGAQNGKFLPCSDQCAAHSKNTFLTHTKGFCFSQPTVSASYSF